MNNTKKFIRSRRISAFLPWVGILGMLYLVFTLIIHGLLTFLIDLGFIANFYYMIDEYNWLIERLLFNREKLITRKQNNIIHLIKLLSVITTITSTVILFFLRQNFINFCIGICFISEVYFSNRLIENIQVILHIAFDIWKKFYVLVFVGTIISTTTYIFLLYLNIIAYFIYFGIISIMYLITYYILIEIHDKVENDLGGHRYFIDLPDNRFDRKY